jgi:protein-S-isoprenylcysteine O-methyltransferase Ste14
MNNTIFYINLSIHYIIFGFVLWSIFFSSKRIWPPPSKQSWQYKIYWNLFYIGIILDIILIIQEFNIWVIPNEIRYFIGIPLILIGTFIVSFGVYILGIKNTYGLENGFIDKTPYKYTRNPQYLGDIILIIGLMLFVNSLNLTVLFILTIIIFVIMPFSEKYGLKKNMELNILNTKIKLQDLYKLEFV